MRPPRRAADYPIPRFRQAVASSALSATESGIPMPGSTRRRLILPGIAAPSSQRRSPDAGTLGPPAAFKSWMPRVALQHSRRRRPPLATLPFVFTLTAGGVVDPCHRHILRVRGSLPPARSSLGRAAVPPLPFLLRPQVCVSSCVCSDNF